MHGKARDSVKSLQPFDERLALYALNSLMLAYTYRTKWIKWNEGWVLWVATGDIWSKSSQKFYNFNFIYFSEQQGLFFNIALKKVVRESKVENSGKIFRRLSQLLLTRLCGWSWLNSASKSVRRKPCTWRLHCRTAYHRIKR